MAVSPWTTQLLRVPSASQFGGEYLHASMGSANHKPVIFGPLELSATHIDCGSCSTEPSVVCPPGGASSVETEALHGASAISCHVKPKAMLLEISGDLLNLFG